MMEVAVRELRNAILAIGLVIPVVLSAREVGAQGCADKTAPTVAITSPARAEQIQAGGLAPFSLTVTGEASDSESAIVSIQVDGVEVLSSPGGLVEPFSVVVDSPWGMNTLVVSAADACGNRAEIVHSFIRGAASSGFYPAATADDSNAQAAGGIRVRLGQQVIDDGNRNDLDDLATFLDNELGSLDVNSVIPTTIQDEDVPKCNNVTDNWISDKQKELRITRGTITAGAFAIDSIIPRSSGLEVKGSLASLSMPVTIKAFECVAGNRDSTDFDGTFSLTNARVTIVGTAAVSAGKAHVTISSSTASTDSVDFTMHCGSFQSLCNAVTNDLVDSFKGAIENKIANTIENKIPGTVEPFLEALDVGSAVSLPAPLGTVVALESGLDEITIGAGFVTIGNFTQFHPDSRGAEIPAAAPGSIRRFGASPVSFTGTRDIALSAKDDLINQLLWSLWYGGFLDFDDVSNLIHVDGVERLALVANLPPVWMPGAAPDGAVVGLGEVFVDTTIDTSKIDSVPDIGELSLRFVLGATIDGVVVADGAKQTFGFDAQGANVELQVLDISIPGLGPAVTPFLEGILEGLLPDLVESFVGRLPLPKIPVESLGGTPGFALSLSQPTADRPAGKNGTRIEGDVGLVPVCGDGLRRGSEQCDDGNRVFGDGCDPSCLVESGWTCAGAPSACELICSNGRIDAGETCDDGGLVDGDGCDSSCGVESGWECAGEPSTCALICSNGRIDAGETCDDGGLVAGDGCDDTCQREPGYACTGEPSACVGVGARVPLKRMVVQNVLPDDPRKNRLTLVAEDPAIPQPLPGSADDPRCVADGGSGAGGRIAVRMAPSEEYAQDLPCEGWKLLGTADRPKGFEYHDRRLVHGACKLVLVKQTRLIKAVCLGRGTTPLTLDLVEGVPRDPATAQLVLGTEQFYCAEAAGKISRDGSDGRRFLARNQLSPPTCP